MLFIFCYTNILLYEGKSNDFKNKTKKNYDRKIWLFDFCEALARVSGKRQCAECAMAFLLFLLRVGRKTKYFVFLVSNGFYFIVKFSISFQVCCVFSFSYALLLSDDAMASAGIDCSSAVCQHKCKLRIPMFQRIRKPAFAIAFVSGSIY